MAWFSKLFRAVCNLARLFFPVIFPSWRFFSGIGPSPRIEYAFLSAPNEQPATWYPFRTIPQRLGIVQSLKRLFHNPEWNELLYINICAEHLFEGYSTMREQEIMRRLVAAFERGELVQSAAAPYVVFRIVAVVREGTTVSYPVAFISQAASLRVVGLEQTE